MDNPEQLPILALLWSKEIRGSVVHADANSLITSPEKNSHIVASVDGGLAVVGTMENLSGDGIIVAVPPVLALFRT